MGRTSTEAKERHNNKAYDQIKFRLPKGGKEWLKESAERKGYTSVNKFITDAVKKFAE